MNKSILHPLVLTQTKREVRTFKTVLNLARKPWLGMSLGLLILLSCPNMRLPYSIGVNVTNSLPNRFFWLSPSPANWQKYDYAVFDWMQEKYYPKGVQFIKQVLGVPGDDVQIKGADIFINAQYIGNIRPQTSSGMPITPGPTGVIPADFYFVYAPHPLSLDSRYQVVGWLPKNKLIAQATPIF